MSSQIRYKFVNSREGEGSVVVFDGISLSMDLLKRAIVNQEKLTASGMDLVVTDTSGIIFAPTAIVLKNTSVLVKQKAPTLKTVHVSSGSVIPGLGAGYGLEAAMMAAAPKP